MSGGVWGRERRLLTIGLIGLITAVAFEGLAVATVLPQTAAELDGLALYGWSFSAFWLTNILGITLAGGDADRHGPVELKLHKVLERHVALRAHVAARVVRVPQQLLQLRGVGIVGARAVTAAAAVVVLQRRQATQRAGNSVVCVETRRRVELQEVAGAALRERGGERHAQERCRDVRQAERDERQQQ